MRFATLAAALGCVLGMTGPGAAETLFCSDGATAGVEVEFGPSGRCRLGPVAGEAGSAGGQRSCRVVAPEGQDGQVYHLRMDRYGTFTLDQSGGVAVIDGRCGHRL